MGLFDGSKPTGKELVIQEDRIVWAGHQREARCSHDLLLCFDKGLAELVLLSSAVLLIAG